MGGNGSGPAFPRPPDSCGLRLIRDKVSTLSQSTHSGLSLQVKRTAERGDQCLLKALSVSFRPGNRCAVIGIKVGQQLDDLLGGQ